MTSGIPGIFSFNGALSSAARAPCPLVHLNVRMPAQVFIDCMPNAMRMVPRALEDRGLKVAAFGRMDLRGEWWWLQSEINRAHDTAADRGLKLFYTDAKAAFEAGRREMRGGRGPAFACADFLSSAVLFAVSGERGMMLARAVQETAASAGEAGRPAAAAIMYEKAFLVGGRPQHAAAAASSWLESMRGDRDPSTLGFRAERGLLLAALGGADALNDELLIYR